MRRLEIWPRLGSDHVTGSSLSTTYRMWVLVDAGNDWVPTRCSAVPATTSSPAVTTACEVVRS